MLPRTEPAWAIWRNGELEKVARHMEVAADAHRKGGVWVIRFEVPVGAKIEPDMIPHPDDGLPLGFESVPVIEPGRVGV